MMWNWEQPDWPRFTWKQDVLASLEQQFLLRAAEFAGTVKHLRQEDHAQLVVEAMSIEAVTTSEIEGEILDRASVVSSIRRQLGLTTDSRRTPPAEQGISEVVVDASRTFAEPLTDTTLFRWHSMLFRNRRDLAEVGSYRTHQEPMEVISFGRDLNQPKVHFVAPPSGRVPQEMEALCGWFNQTAPGGVNPLPAITRAGIVHLYFESIHPFEDGNGRIGRVVSEKAIDQVIGHVTYTSLAAALLARRKDYYQALEEASRHNEITAWLEWFAQAALDAQQRTIDLVEFLLGKARFFEGLRGQLNTRQEKVLLRMFAEGPSGFKGGLSAGNYAKITGAPSTTVTRDLADLVQLRALTRTGERRYARYHLNIKGDG
ncbi:MAG: Fic family protein [Alphaproteobacteria bacterium]|nr:MAG: Fic family protein [Alphaproteobacteria bacterium]